VGVLIQDFVEQVVHGLTLGAMYAMVATGLALMLGVARLINFAHGEFFMLGAYAFWYGYRELELPYPLAGLLAIALMIVWGVVYQRTVIRTILARSWHVQLIATLATSIVLSNLAIIVFGTQPKEVPTPLASRILDIGGVRLAWQRVLVLGGALALFWALHRFVAATRAGRAMRAMSQNREACAVVGVDVQHVALVTFAISAALAAAAATLVSPLFNIFPDMGTGLTLKAFAAVVAGGFGYVNGAIAASFLIGITEALAGSYVSYAYKDAIAFLIMIAVLLWRPQGLFGRRIGI
jgi:branched-chain amino acid transport system permease protein